MSGCFLRVGVRPAILSIKGGKRSMTTLHSLEVDKFSSSIRSSRSPAKWIEKISLFPPFSATSKGPPFLIYHTSGKKARCVSREIAQHTFTQRTFAYIHIAHISLGRHEEDISIRGKRQMEAKHSSPLRRRPHHSFPLLRPQRIGGGGGARRRMGGGGRSPE